MKIGIRCPIADIPYPGLREVAIQRLNEYSIYMLDMYDPKEHSIYGFVGFWKHTSEGYDFWANVYFIDYDKRFEQQTLRRI